MRYVKTRQDLPNYAGDVTVEFSYIESILSAASGMLTANFMRLLSQYHSGIRGEVRFANGTQRTFVLEFWGNGNSTVAPYCVDATGPKWQHNTVVVFTDGWDQSKWYGSKTKGTKIATLNKASQVNEIFEFVLKDWALNPKRKIYSQWQWWPSMNPGWELKHTNYDLICSSFTEAVIWRLSNLTQLLSPIPILRRNYGVVWNEERGKVLSKTDPLVISFYQKVMQQGQNAFFSADLDSKGEVVLYDQVKEQYLYFADVFVRLQYSDMPLPRSYYASCSKDTGAHCFAFCEVLRGAKCISHRCTCPAGTCAWEGRVENYCKGPEEAEADARLDGAARVIYS